MEDKKMRVGGIFAVVCFMLLVFVPTYAQFQLSPLAHLVMPTYDLDQTQFSMLFSAAMIVGIIFSLLAGILCDRFGIKRTVAIAGAITAASLIARIFAPDFATLFICMFGIGFAATFLNANLAKIMGAWFTPDKIGIAVGLAAASPAVAMAIGIGTSALFPSLNSIFVFTSILGVAALVVWLLFYKERPDANQAAGKDEVADQGLQAPPLSECIKVALKSRNVWLIGVILGMDMAAVMCITTFMPQILAGRGMDPASAGAMSSIVTYGSLAGAIFAPIIRVRVGAFKPVAIALAIVAAVFTAIAWLVPEGPLMVVVFFLTGFAQNGLIAIVIALPVLLPEIGPVYAGTAGGLAATMQLTGAVVLPTYILTPLFGDNYFVFYLIAGAFCVIAAVCAFALPELFGKKAE